jgi:D-alanyl-D-alanine carboxypeptidase
MAAGKSRADAEAITATMIAVPGTSEHHTGLAADIVTPTHQTLDPEFADTAAGKWLLENAADYGFILRYPEDKQEITVHVEGMPVMGMPSPSGEDG